MTIRCLHVCTTEQPRETVMNGEADDGAKERRTFLCLDLPSLCANSHYALEFASARDSLTAELLTMADYTLR